MTRLRNCWGELSLVKQFALMACIVVGVGMIVLGSFVSAEIENDVVHNAAVEMALYVSSFDEAHLYEELATGSELSEASLQTLDESFTDTELGRQIVSVKIWRPDGSVVYTTPRDVISSDFRTNPNLQNALRGQMSAQFANPGNEPETLVRILRIPLLKIYTPIHGRKSDRVVAVAQFFTRADLLQADLETARLRSWIAVAAVGLLQIASLYGIVLRGNKTIESQRAVLVDARRGSVETNERFLRRVGADLHDGPAQLISLALLRLSSLRPLLAPEHSKSEEFEKIHAVLQDCLREIRHLSAGLAPPHLDSLPLQRVLELAVRQHQQRTGSTVDAVIDVLPANMSPLHKVFIYRFAQQGLQNAYRHAGGIGQRIHAFSDGKVLTVEVADDGPGFCPSKRGSGDGLGLTGLRDRIESLGGTFSLESQVGAGTTLRASFQIDGAATATTQSEGGRCLLYRVLGDRLPGHARNDSPKQL
jgi:signal transduction histidine kinase